MLKGSIVMKNIKKSDIFLIVALILVVVLGLFMMKGEKLGNGGTFELSYSEYVEKIENDEKFVLVIESATCSHCVSYMPVVKKFARGRDVKVYYVDTNNFSEDEWKSFEETNSFFELDDIKADGWGTPTTLFLSGDDAVDYIVGQTTEEELESYYDKYTEYFEKAESDK